MRHNLSVQRLEKAGLKITFTEGKVFIYQSSQLIACGNKIDNIYIIQFNVAPRSEANSCENKNVEVFKLWHRRFGHLNTGSMLKLCNTNMVKGIPSVQNNSEISKICEICVKSKIAKLPFVRNTCNKSSRPL